MIKIKAQVERERGVKRLHCITRIKIKAQVERGGGGGYFLTQGYRFKHK